MGTPNAAEAKLLSGGGGLGKSGIKTKACKAFRAAVKRWCSGNTSAREFNDVFYNELQKASQYGDLASRLAREAPVLMQGAITAGGVVAVGLGGPGAGTPDDVLNCWNSMEDASGAIAGTTQAYGEGASAMNAMRSVTPPDGFYRRFLDGVLDGEQVVEIKGPGDTFHDAQAADLKTINGNKNPIVLSCKSCGANCNNVNRYKRGCFKR